MKGRGEQKERSRNNVALTEKTKFWKSLQEFKNVDQSVTLNKRCDNMKMDLPLGVGIGVNTE